MYISFGTLRWGNKADKERSIRSRQHVQTPPEVSFLLVVTGLLEDRLELGQLQATFEALTFTDN